MDSDRISKKRALIKLAKELGLCEFIVVYDRRAKAYGIYITVPTPSGHFADAEIKKYPSLQAEKENLESDTHQFVLCYPSARYNVMTPKILSDTHDITADRRGNTICLLMAL
ncbi:MAG: hypothetical protein AAF846_25425 [Chloroflexota bacterium]